MCTLKTIRPIVFILILLGVPSILAQRQQKKAPPDFQVQLTDKRTVFYSDESINFSVMLRADQKLPNCDFGGRSKIQVLRNGNVIATFTPGPVSRLHHGRIQEVLYASYGWSLGRWDFLDNLHLDKKIEIAPDETFQFRAFCGDHASEPSRPFHITEWREPVDGLQVFVTPLKSAYKVGEPIRVKVEMRNVGSKSKWCPVPLPEDAYARRFWVLEPHWTDSREPVDDNLTYSRGLRILKPGASQTAIFVLNHFKDSHLDRHRVFGNERGRFRLWLAVYADAEDDVPAKYRANLWRGGGLESNPFEIVIE